MRRHDADLLPSPGEDATAHSGEEQRQELRAGMQNRGDELKAVPWAAGPGFVGKGPRGHLLCAPLGDRVFLGFLKAEDSDLVRHVLTCLSPARCTEHTRRHLPDDIVHFYARIQVDIQPITGPIRNLEERLAEATKLGAIPYVPSGFPWR